MRNIFDLALELEREGEQYYRKQAQATTDQQLQQLFTMLAADELRHEKVIARISKNEQGVDTTLSSDTVKQAKDIFASRLEQGEIFQADINRLQAYQHAIEREIESIKLYTDLANQAQSEHNTDVFTKLAKEEEGHRIILQNLMELIRRPHTWVESAEFNHMEKY